MDYTKINRIINTIYIVTIDTIWTWLNWMDAPQNWVLFMLYNLLCQHSDIAGCLLNTHNVNFAYQLTALTKCWYGGVGRCFSWQCCARVNMLSNSDFQSSSLFLIGTTLLYSNFSRNHLSGSITVLFDRSLTVVPWFVFVYMGDNENLT